MGRSRIRTLIFATAVAGCGDDSSTTDGANSTSTGGEPSSTTAGLGSSGGVGSSGGGTTVGATSRGGSSSSGIATSATGDATGTTAGTTGGASTGGVVDPCALECGSEEVCDDGHLGLDDDCDGQVDPTCACTPGLGRSCFRGDPSFIGSPGCVTGTQACTAAGTWGPCEGGVHADEMCFLNNGTCAAIAGRPFAPVDLSTGVGVFGSDAITEVYSVACPAGIAPCPVASGSDYTALQSGEYLVTYDKTTAMGNDACQFPLTIGAPGLRVELSWEWDAALGPQTVDLDLHVHEPADTSFWGGLGGNASDCAFDTCTVDQFEFGLSPIQWFNGVAPPDPVDWYLDPTFENNTCYFAPAGVGLQWQAVGMGCHNPRIDLDNILCDPTVVDPQNTDFCSPENINIDYPPVGEWTRIAVSYYSAHGQTYDVHPRVRIHCDGSLAADLGPEGYDAPVTFAPGEAASAHWLVADVRYVDDACGRSGCEVVPVYENAVVRTPLVSNVLAAMFDFGPPYPP